MMARMLLMGIMISDMAQLMSPGQFDVHPGMRIAFLVVALFFINLEKRESR